MFGNFYVYIVWVETILKKMMVKESISIAIHWLPFWVRKPVDAFGLISGINKLFYTAVFVGQLLIPYFIAQHNKMRNFKIIITFPTIKPTRGTLSSQIYFWNKTLHVSDSSSVHHQEYFTINTVMVNLIQLASKIRILLASCQQTYMTITITVHTVKNSWWWTEELS